MKLLNVPQVMEKLSMSRSKVYRMVNNGTLPSVIIGGCTRIPEEILDEMLINKLKEGKNKTKIENIHVLSGGWREGGSS